MISMVWRTCMLYMAVANHTLIYKVWRTRVSQSSVCVMFGARLRLAPLNLWGNHGRPRIPHSRKIHNEMYVLSHTCLPHPTVRIVWRASAAQELRTCCVCMAQSKYTRNCMVLRTRVSQATLCVTFGARRRWAPLNALGIHLAIWATKACQECWAGSC